MPEPIRHGRSRYSDFLFHGVLIVFGCIVGAAAGIAAAYLIEALLS